MDMKKNKIAIAKCIDGYLDLTSLAEYCREQGFVVAQEYVIIEKPTGRKEKLIFQQNVRAGKIIVVKKGGS
jgi:hypothetical protein